MLLGCCATQALLLAIPASMASTPHWMLLSVMLIVAMLILKEIRGKEASATLTFGARSGMTVSILCATTLLPSCIGQ